MNLILILGVLFASLLAVITLLDGKAKPLEDEQASRLSTWLTIAVCVLLVAAVVSRL